MKTSELDKHFLFCNNQVFLNRGLQILQILDLIKDLKIHLIVSLKLTEVILFLKTGTISRELLDLMWLNRFNQGQAIVSLTSAIILSFISILQMDDWFCFPSFCQILLDEKEISARFSSFSIIYRHRLFLYFFVIVMMELKVTFGNLGERSPKVKNVLFIYVAMSSIMYALQPNCRSHVVRVLSARLGIHSVSRF